MILTVEELFMHGNTCMLRYFFGVILTAIAKRLMAMADISDNVLPPFGSLSALKIKI